MTQPHRWSGAARVLRTSEPARRGSTILRLVAQVGLPPQLLDIVTIIPVGKGIAGETAAEEPARDDLQFADRHQRRRQARRETDRRGRCGLCVPIRNGEKIVGTFGIGTKREHEYSAAEINALQDIANSLATQLA